MHFIYVLWFLSLLTLAGLLDRRWGRLVCARILPELPASHPWYRPPIISLLVPGAGQLLNQQPAKGLLCFLWPFILVSLNHPGPTQTFALWWLIQSWYAWVATDALLTSVTRTYRQPRRLRRTDD